MIILITGASRGIGAATAWLAAQKAYTVCINYKNNYKAADAVRQQILNNGGKAHLFPANIAKAREVVQLFEQIDKKVGRIDALVNNAGILGKRTTLVNMSAERIQEVFDTNIIGSLLCAKEAIKRMSTKWGGKGGAIVNVSSAAARLGAPFEYVDYAATKGAMDTMTIGLAKEVAAEGIRINAVRPGLIETDIHEAGRLQDLVHGVPMKRTGTAEEVAEVILWLLSEKAAYVTGTNIDITGGR